jgi:hypothetical protein
MGLWTHVRRLAAGALGRLLESLAATYGDELRLGRQLRLHAERVPYPSLAASLLALADRADMHAAALREEIARLGGGTDALPVATPRGGRNHWERLATDLEDLQAMGKRYLELAQRWDGDFPETAALLGRLARENAGMRRAVQEMIALSDPHAAD